MTRNMICIGCPMGCALTVEVERSEASPSGRSEASPKGADHVVSVSGNTCNIGRRYAETEVSAPVRMVTTTAPSDGGVPVPVRTRIAVPKDRVFDVVRAVKAQWVALPVAMGDVILADAAGTGIDVIATMAVPY